MAEELHDRFDAELLPIRQRIAWMAAIWSLSVGIMVAVTWIVKLAFG